MRFSFAFLLAVLPILAAAAPVDVSSAKLVTARAARALIVSSYADQLARDMHRIHPAPATSSTEIKTRGEHAEADSPEMTDGYDGGKTVLDGVDHKVAYTVSDDNVPATVGSAVKTVTDGTTHQIDSSVISEDPDKGSPKGQAEGHGSDLEGLKVEVHEEGDGLGQGL